jgi:FkbM family methyltransferase
MVYDGGFRWGPHMIETLADELVSKTFTVRGRSFQIYDHPVVRSAERAFANGSEASGSEGGTLRLFDAILPRCDRMIDFGAHVGFTSLYAASYGVDVAAFEPSRVSFQFLSANVEVNHSLAPRIRLYNHGIGARDEAVRLYSQACADGEASVFQVIERAQAVAAAPEAAVELRAGVDVLRHAGVNRRTLLNIDIEGGEYALLPAIADLLAERKPWLNVSFHPFNLAADRAPYDAAIQRLRSALQVAEATSSYRYMHLFLEGDWCTVGSEERMGFLERYLMQPKAVPGIASPQYGFVGAVVFADALLPAGA